MWPGFGENSRVLKWIVDRLEGKAEGVETPIGILPAKGALDTDGLDLSEADLDFLLTVDKEVWREEARWSPSTSTPSATTRRRSCGTSTGRWCSAWAEPSPRRRRPPGGRGRRDLGAPTRSAAGRTCPDLRRRQAGRGAHPAGAPHDQCGAPATVTPWPAGNPAGHCERPRSSR